MVIAGSPIRNPDGLKGGLGSLGMVLFEVEIPTASSKSSACFPSNSVQVKSMTMR